MSKLKQLNRVVERKENNLRNAGKYIETTLSNYETCVLRGDMYGASIHMSSIKIMSEQYMIDYRHICEFKSMIAQIEGEAA